ncbi:MAG: UbiA family prenyltransferase [Rhodothermus sp.]|nr:UbiA family prenyltransferase [Rhodothermus sp.]
MLARRYQQLHWSCVHIPLVAVGLLAGNAALLQLALSLPLVVLEAVGVWAVYVLDRAWLAGDEDWVNRPVRAAWWRQHRQVAGVLAVVAIALGGWAAAQVRPVTLAASAGLGLVGLLYTLPGLRLKQWGLLKPLLIAGTWSLGSTLLPVLEAGHALDQTVWLLLLYRLLWLLPNALLADWPDRAGDRWAGIRTPAVRWSYATLRRASLVLLVGALGAGMLLVGRIRFALVVGDGLGVVLTGLTIGLARTDITEHQLFLLDLLVGWPFLTALARGWMGL